MQREVVTELHYITHIDNLISIAKLGILSYHDARKLQSISIAAIEVQDLRTGKKVPGGLALHDYVNLYFHARNPMMSKRRGHHGDIAVLRVSPDLLECSGVVIADGNAASKYTGFWSPSKGLSALDRDLVYSEDWRDPDQIQQWRKARVRCAEVLVPVPVKTRHILGSYASCQASRARIEGLGLGWSVSIDSHLFFQS